MFAEIHSLPSDKQNKMRTEEEPLDIGALYSYILARLEFVQFATCRH
jgi:hypothetical protein